MDSIFIKGRFYSISDTGTSVDIESEQGVTGNQAVSLKISSRTGSKPAYCTIELKDFIIIADALRPLLKKGT